MEPCTEHDYHRRIIRVTQATLAGLVAPHTVQSLAVVAHLLSFRFHRIYRTLIGESVFETVQRIRLVQAAWRLNGTEDSVTDATLNVGYGSPQTFVHAFRELTGVSPHAFQTRQQALNVHSADTEDSSPTELIQQPLLHAFYLCHDGPVAAIRQTFITLRQPLNTGMESADAPDHIGICHGNPETPGSFGYFAGVILGASHAVTGPLLPTWIEGDLCTCHRLIGPHTLIAPTIQALYGRRFPSYGSEPDDQPAFGLYRGPGWHHLPCACVTDLMIPIRKK